jgi:hypothetical protein
MSQISPNKPPEQKRPPLRERKLRTSARGQLCMIRIDGVCNCDTGTTVLAHAPHDANKGTSFKPDDIGAWACSNCHDFIDGRSTVLGVTRARRMALFYEGVYRTVCEQVRQSILVVK